MLAHYNGVNVQDLEGLENYLEILVLVKVIKNSLLNLL